MLVLTFREREDSAGQGDILMQNLCFRLLGAQSYHTAVDLHEMDVVVRYSASDDLKPQSMQVVAKEGPPVK